MGRRGSDRRLRADRHGLQTIVSRQVDITDAPAVVTIGRIDGGVRINIIPDSVVLEGTIRALDPAVQRNLHARVKRTAESIAASAGADRGRLVRDRHGAHHLQRTSPHDPDEPDPAAASNQRLFEARPRPVAEDFSRFQQKVPGMFFYLGVNRPGADPSTVAANHSPLFYVDEGALPMGVRALSALAIDFLSQ